MRHVVLLLAVGLCVLVANPAVASDRYLSGSTDISAAKRKKPAELCPCARVSAGGAPRLVRSIARSGRKAVSQSLSARHVLGRPGLRPVHELRFPRVRMAAQA